MYIHVNMYITNDNDISFHTWNFYTTIYVMQFKNGNVNQNNHISI